MQPARTITPPNNNQDVDDDDELADEDVSEDDELGADDVKYDAGAALRAAHQLLASEYAPHQAAGRQLPGLSRHVATASPNAINGFLRRQHPGSSGSTYLAARRYAEQWNLPDPDVRRRERAAAGAIETARREQARSTGPRKATGVLRDLSSPDRP